MMISLGFVETVDFSFFGKVISNLTKTLPICINHPALDIPTIRIRQAGINLWHPLRCIIAEISPKPG